MPINVNLDELDGREEVVVTFNLSGAANLRELREGVGAVLKLLEPAGEWRLTIDVQPLKRVDTVAQLFNGGGTAYFDADVTARLIPPPEEERDTLTLNRGDLAFVARVARARVRELIAARGESAVNAEDLATLERVEELLG